MYPRYLVTYKHYNGQTVELLTAPIGRFSRQEEAEARARELLDRPGNEITKIRQETRFEAATHRAARFFIRSLRIATSVAVGVSAYFWLYNSGPKIGDIPFSRLTLNLIASSLIRTALFIGIVFVCWGIAFGKGPEV